MIDFLSLFGIGVAAFVATNIDDIFVLMIFFSSRRFLVRDVVLGQYLGIGILIGISAIGSIIAFIIPLYVIGLMGFVPIVIGIIRLLHLKNGEKVPERVTAGKKGSYWSFLTVAAVTFSNGGDNIGVYTPLFAKYNDFGAVITIVSTFMIMTGLWCLIGYYLVRHPLIARRLRNTGHIVLPFVLIGLGIYILLDSFVIPS